MGFAKKSNTPLSLFLNAVAKAGGTVSPGTGGVSSAYVASISNPASVSASNPLVFTVTLRATTTSTLTLVYSSFGTALGDYDYQWQAAFSNGVIQQGANLLIPAGVNSFTITYTTNDKGPFTTPKSLYTLLDLVTAESFITSPPEAWYALPLATGMTLPSDFVGMHGSNSFSNAAYTNLATCYFENFRTHDHGTPGLGVGLAHTLFWNEIERSATPGDYDWVEFDNVVNTMYSAGKGVTFCLYGTPSWRAISPPALVWQANHTYTAVSTANYANGNALQSVDFTKYAHPTTLAGRRYAPVVTGYGGDSGLTSSGTQPTWPSTATDMQVFNSATLTWSAGTVTVDCTVAHNLTNLDVVNLFQFGVQPWAGFYQITVTGANTFTFAQASSTGFPNTGVKINRTFLDGTCRWAPAQLALDLYYLNAGGYPASPTAVNTFVAAVMARYNTGGIRKITRLEVWNEPDNSQSGQMYFSGSMPQLVDMVWAARLASKAADGATNSIPVIGCGFTFNSTAGNSNPVIVDSFLTATGITYNTTTGVAAIVDGFGWHTYGATTDAYGGTLASATAGAGNGNILTNGINGGWNINNLRARIVAAGGSSSMPMYLTEWGLFGDTASKNIVNNTMSAALRKNYLLNWLLFLACTGQKMAGIYDYFGNFGGQYNSDSVDNTTGVRGALYDYDTFFKGKVVTSAYYSNAHKVKVTICGVDYIYDAQPVRAAGVY